MRSGVSSRRSAAESNRVLDIASRKGNAMAVPAPRKTVRLEMVLGIAIPDTPAFEMDH